MAMEKTMTDIVDMAHNVGLMGTVDPLMYKFAIFILAIFIGYYVIWSVTPALQTRYFTFFLYIDSIRYVTKKPPKIFIDASMSATKPKPFAM